MNCPAALPDLSINDVASSEGNSGTTTFTFTVSLTAPAPASGVTFDIATADSSAVSSGVLAAGGSDFAAQSLTSQTIPATQQTYNFTVDVNGDTVYEPSTQQYFVNIVNVSGANVIDAQGLGTIIDEDGYPQLSASSADSVFEGDSGNNAADILYTLSNTADQDTLIDISTADGTATLVNSDYVQLIGGTAVIPAGDLTVQYNGALTVGDTVPETDETFSVAVDNYSVGIVHRAPGGTTLPQPTVVTIVNDDTSADLSISVTDSPDPVVQGQNITYVVTLTNLGPNNAPAANFSLPLPIGTTFVSLTQPGMWNCSTPAVGAHGTVSCNDGMVPTAVPASAKMGVGSAVFTIIVNVDLTVAPGTELSSVLSAGSATQDPNGGNNATTATTLVAAAVLPSVPVPALDRHALWLMVLAMLGMAAMVQRRTH
ncbi:MAG TPA: Calx-beta domain-containing protein [Patescibacteria group bacterium]|nr:Calx-beta domain-containing protein [Patescibacteria group bacterium]